MDAAPRSAFLDAVQDPTESFSLLCGEIVENYGDTVRYALVSDARALCQSLKLKFDEATPSLRSQRPAAPRCKLPAIPQLRSGDGYFLQTCRVTLKGFALPRTGDLRLELAKITDLD